MPSYRSGKSTILRRIFGKVILKTLLLMKKLVLIALLGFWLPLAMFAQRTVQLGGYVFVPEQNLAGGRAGSRGHVLRDLEQPVNGYRNALVQLRELPTQAERAALARQGVELGDYLGAMPTGRWCVQIATRSAYAAAYSLPWSPFAQSGSLHSPLQPVATWRAASRTNQRAALRTNQRAALRTTLRAHSASFLPMHGWGQIG